MVLPFYSVLSYHISLQDINMNVAHVRAIGVSRMYQIINGLCLQADVETLKKYCGPEVIERCKAEHKAYQSNGIFFDNKVRNFTFPCLSHCFLALVLVLCIKQKSMTVSAQIGLHCVII